jgi:hypothetical protein
MSLVMLKRRGNGRNSAAAATTTVAWGEIPFQDGAPFSDQWVQRLRRPGKHAVVCLDGFLSMDFSQDDGDGPCHRRFVRHTPSNLDAPLPYYVSCPRLILLF